MQEEIEYIIGKIYEKLMLSVESGHLEICIAFVFF